MALRWRQGGWRRQDSLVGVLLVVAFIVSAWQVRGSTFSVALAVIPLSAWIARWRERVEVSPSRSTSLRMAAHSILRHSLGEHPAAVAADNPFFRQWCERALGEGGDVTSKLFAIRAAGLLQDLQSNDAAACLSGLLIGGEIASAQRRYGASAAPVVLVASGALAALYAAALGVAGLAFRTVDADEAVRAGLVEAARENGMIGAAA